jgi:transcriptional regulator with XRE-family HTH domain
MTAINEFMRDLRRRRKMNQEDMAATLKWVQSKVCKIEKGKQQPTFADLEAVSKTFGVSMRKLINLRWKSS